MLEQALSEGVFACRQIDQHFPSNPDLSIEFIAVRLGERAGVIADGKNLQTVAELQSRLAAAQQAVERDYWQFREIETRFRLLFDDSIEAVMAVCAAGLAIGEAYLGNRRPRLGHSASRAAPSSAHSGQGVGRHRL